MTTPFSWLGVGAVAAPLAMKTFEVANKSMGQAFGSFLQPDAPKTSGLSESTKPQSQDTSDQPLSEELRKLTQELTQWLKSKGEELGISVEGLNFKLDVNQDQSLSVDGPEPFKSEMESMLALDAEFVQKLRSLAMRTTSPLAWLPGTNTGSMLTLRIPGTEQINA
jgi:hypothetical protein